MTVSFAECLNALEQEAQAEHDVLRALTYEQLKQRLDLLMLPIGREAGQLVHFLARIGHYMRLLELGTSVGYSTLWLAAAARHTGGTLTTIDYSPAKQARAMTVLTEAG